MKQTKDTSYEIIVLDKFGCNVFDRDDLENAMKVYETHKDNPLVKEIIVQKVERFVVKRLFNGKESNY